MRHAPFSLKTALIACSVPGAIVALTATLGAWSGWGGLSFSSPIYYVTLAVALWCPVGKIVAWRFWRREMTACLVCLPAKSAGQRLSPNMDTADHSGLIKPMNGK